MDKVRLAKYLTWVTGLIILDQVVKFWSRNAAQMTEGRTFWALWPNVFELKLVFNKGIAFGMAQGFGALLTPIAVAITGYSIYHIAKAKNDPPGVFTALTLLAAGAVGNLIDRLSPLRMVTDMFYFRLIDFPVFNVADIYITFSAATIILLAIRDTFAKKPDPAPVTPDPAAAEGATATPPDPVE